MTEATRKISMRLDARLHDKLQELVKISPHRSMTAVIEKMIVAGLSDASTVRPRVYLEAVVANLAAIFDLLLRDRNLEPEALTLATHFYGILLEMTIVIDGVEP